MIFLRLRYTEKSISTKLISSIHLCVDLMDIKMSGLKTDIVYGSYRGAIAHLFVVVIKYYLLYVEEDTL